MQEGERRVANIAGTRLFCAEEQEGTPVSEICCCDGGALDVAPTHSDGRCHPAA